MRLSRTANNQLFPETLEAAIEGLGVTPVRDLLGDRYQTFSEEDWKN
jgi:hypothetical protein